MSFKETLLAKCVALRKVPETYDRDFIKQLVEPYIENKGNVHRVKSVDGAETESQFKKWVIEVDNDEGMCFKIIKKIMKKSIR